MWSRKEKTVRHYRRLVRRRGLTLVLSLALGLLVIGTAGATGTLDQSQTASDGSGIVFGNLQQAQTFTASLSGVLDQVDLRLFKQAVDPDNLIVQIQTVSGGVPSGTVIASATVPPTGISTSFPGDWVSVPFSPGAGITAGTQYAIVLSSPNTAEASRGWLFALSDGGAYAGGTILDRFDPFPWSVVDIFDMTFKTYVSPGVHDLSPAHLWLGLKNSDDQGTQFDLKVELLKNGTPVASGLTRCITGVTRNASLAKEAIVNWDAGAAALNSGDTLSLRASTRIGTNPDDTKCAGHSSAQGLRLYYDSTSTKSRFDATIDPNPNADEYLHSNGNPCVNAESTSVTTRYFDSSAPTSTSAKCKDSSSINFAGGNLFKEIGTWTVTVP